MDSLENEPVAGATPTPDEGSALLTRGLAYLNGTGVPHNCSQALVYLDSSARRGNAKANSQLGGLYATGHCVPLDRARAYQYFTRAREAEHGRNVYIERNRQMLWSQMSDAEKAQARAVQ
jgi:TPR repeat protein